MSDALELQWAPHALSLELRKVLSYRVDFWLNLFCALFARAGLAYFLWKEIFALHGGERIAGYDFHGMMIYYVIAAFIYEINQLDLSYFAEDIHTGALTRYLVFPLSFFQYKYVLSFAKTLVHLVQIGILLFVVYAFVGVPSGLHITPGSVALGILTTLVANYLIFTITACLDMVAFWVNKVWSLGVMLQLTTQFLGGLYLPIAAFPDWSRELVQTLPFYYLVAFPVRTFFGEISGFQVLRGLGIAFAWALFFTFVGRIVWRRGLAQYTGVGQ